MFRFLVRLFALIGFVLVLVIVGGGFAAYRAFTAEEPMPDRIVLDLDLDRPLIEHVPTDPVAEALFGRRETIRDIVDGLDRARLDPRVHGLVARFGSEQFGLAEAQELREAVGRFRASGRFAFAYADSFGEFGTANSAFYLASTFDEVWMQPVGMVGLTGIAAEVPFVRQALEELYLRPSLEHRHEFKSFSNTFTETGFTEAHRSMMESLVEDLGGQLVEGVAEGRELAPERVRDLIDRAPLLDREAVEAGLVDRLGYLDEVRDAALRRAGSGTDRVPLLDYLDRAGRPNDRGTGVALIYGVGAIQRGDSGVSPLFGGPSLGADTIVRAFDEAVRDPAVRAILFRVDSGGGSAVASESIRRAVRRARDAGKPVVVSMGSSAASGGYWIAMSADEIIAQPGTLTGSIGVVAGKLVTGDLWDEIGVGWGRVVLGRNATMWSTLSDYSESERERLDAMLDDIYAAFTRNVAEARGLPPAAVEDVARGRVWTGRQALSLGLVDGLGGMDAAMAAVRRRAGLEPDAPLDLDVFPRPDSRFERFLALATGRTGTVQEALLAEFRPWLRQIEAAAAIQSGKVLVAPETGLDAPR